MEQLYTDLPPLPSEDDPCSAAVRSVYNRGFYDQGLPAVSFQPARMSQFGRLVEEVGELIEASATMKIRCIAEESADVLIVLCQLAWLYGMRPAALLEISDAERVASLPVGLSKLWRAMRRNDVFWIHDLLVSMACHVRQSARIREIDMVQAMSDKLMADEQRGIAHGEATYGNCR